MAIDGIVLSTIVNELQAYVPCKLNKIQQISQFELLFSIRANHENHKLFLSLHSVYNRINITKESYTTLEVPTNFLMLLRKQCDGAIIKSIEQVGLDRIIVFTMEARDELGDIHEKKMYVELMGKYANVVLVDENNIIIDAMKRIPPFENNQRTILPSAKFVLPKAHLDKKDPFVDDTFDENIALYKQFHGFSPLLAKEVMYRLANHETFKDIMTLIKNSKQLYISDIDEQSQFHIIPLTHLETKVRSYDLMHGFDVLFFEKEEKVRIKQQSGDLFKVVRQELNKNRTKLPKLQQAFDEACDLDHYREYGDLIFAYMHQIQKQPLITLTSFETNEPVEIPIDMRYDLKYNANKYYQKYHKCKRAQEVLLQQISLCEEEITYFENLETQLSLSDVKDAIEIREELVKKGYLKAKKSLIRKRKKVELPHFDTYEFDDYKIYVGKNNLQNDYVTWKLAKKNNYWLHAKDHHGAHVIITKSELDEQALRDGAMLAAYYSNARYSSSVAIDYCLVKDLKKIPANFGSLVSLSTYKTIYIDPDSEYIQELIDKYRK